MFSPNLYLIRKVIIYSIGSYFPFWETGGKIVCKIKVLLTPSGLQAVTINDSKHGLKWMGIFLPGSMSFFETKLKWFILIRVFVMETMLTKCCVVRDEESCQCELKSSFWLSSGSSSASNWEKKKSIYCYSKIIFTSPIIHDNQQLNLDSYFWTLYLLKACFMLIKSCAQLTTTSL